MKAFLSDQRSWGAWILENDKLCRTMVATLLAAYEQTGSLAQDDEELGSNAAAHTALPHMGERQPKGED